MAAIERSHTDQAHERGKGNYGDDLPMANRNTEDNMANSMPDTPASALEKGYVAEGSITGDTKSHDAFAKPGSNNHDSEVEWAGDTDEAGE